MALSRAEQVLCYADLPDGVCEHAAGLQQLLGLYGYLSRPLIDGLVEFIGGRRVLEAFAGRGQLGALLRERGVDVRLTSLRQGHDGSAALGHVVEVEDLDVVSAVAKYQGWMDVLLVCWPVADSSLLRALPLLPPHAQIIFIGEVTDYTISPPFLGGCACDGFFDRVEEVADLPGGLVYPSRRCRDQLKIYRVAAQ